MRARGQGQGQGLEQQQQQQQSSSSSMSATLQEVQIPSNVDLRDAATSELSLLQKNYEKMEQSESILMEELKRLRKEEDILRDALHQVKETKTAGQQRKDHQDHQRNDKVRETKDQINALQQLKAALLAEGDDSDSSSDSSCRDDDNDDDEVQGHTQTTMNYDYLESNNISETGAGMNLDQISVGGIHNPRGSESESDDQMNE